jgi:hypothetical protein
MSGDRCALVVLFQGVVALPVALGLQAVTSAGERPDNPLLDQLSIALSLSQAFALPVVIALLMAERYRTSSLTFAVATLVHFAPYSWLYQTPLYLVLAGVISVGLLAVCRFLDRSTNRTTDGSSDRSSDRSSDIGDEDDGAWPIPLVVGTVLVAGSVVAW